MTDRPDPLICAVCACGSSGLGWMPRHAKGPPLFVCDDPECLTIARNTYSMRQNKFDLIEKMATEDAGRALEAYCEAIGKSDFRAFSQAEFEEGMAEVIKAYRLSLKGLVADEAPF